MHYSLFDFVQTALLFIFLIWATPVLGTYMFRIFEHPEEQALPVIGTLEKAFYRTAGVNAAEEMTWGQYLKSVLVFNILGYIVLFLILMFQNLLPLNPQNFPGIPLDLAYNTTSSYVTNTNWQAYSGESTMSYFSQMLGMTVQNFVSAGVGLAVMLALIRGIVRKTSSTIGNFWRDLTRSVLYILLPLSILFALVFVWQGTVQNFSPYVMAHTLEGKEQTIPMGPVASQVAIKQLGTNGGGYFNANSAHPFENPTPLTNFLQTFAILLIPAASAYMFGLFANSKRQGWLIFNVMLFFLIGALAIALSSEFMVNPILGEGSNWEGKETRFGIGRSILWGVVTTATSNGSVNSMISSYSPIAGGISLFNMMLGELMFGGVGVGLCAIIMFVLLTVFICGLMVGRTPEFLGKKIEKKEILWVMVAVLTPGAINLIASALATVIPSAMESISSRGPHGLTEILYTFTSATANNGSSFAGINANTLFYNFTLGTIMLITRLAIIVPSLVIAGLLVKKKITPPTIGTFSTDSIFFAILIIAIILIVGALTFFPALSLGPVIEHFLLLRGQTF